MKTKPKQLFQELMMAVCIMMPAIAQAVLVTKIADTSTLIPGGTNTFRDFYDPSVRAGQVAFVGIGQSDPDQFDVPAGAYLFKGGSLIKVADTSTAVPNGGGEFANFQTVSLDEGQVAFWVFWTSVGSGIYLGDGGPVTTLVDSGMQVPGKSENFVFLSPPSFRQGRMAFAGHPAVTQGGVYLYDGGLLKIVANTMTPVPGSPGHFTSFDQVSLHDTRVVFRATSTTNEISTDGIYLFSNGSLSTVVDGRTPVPGSTNYLGQFPVGPVWDGTNVLFVAYDTASQWGLYLWTGGAVRKVVDGQTPIPGGKANFEYFYSFAVDGDNVVFNGSDGRGRSGIYLFHAGVLSKVTDTDDRLDGKAVFSFGLGSEALSGDLLAFVVWFKDRTSGIYVTTVECNEEPVIQFNEVYPLVKESAGRRTIAAQCFGNRAGPVSVHFTTTDGTARAGVDYVPQDCTVTFAPGETNQAFTVFIIDDEETEGDKTAYLTLSNPTGGARLGTNSIVELTIVDDDRPGTAENRFDPDSALVPGTLDVVIGVTALALQSDGRIVVGGYFVDLTDHSEFGIARLWPDGSFDWSFALGGSSNGLRVIHYARAMALQPDGQVLVASGYWPYPLLRLREDGALDESFRVTLEGDLLRTIAVQPDGKILLGGSFTNVNGTTRNGIARLNPDGSLDRSFDPGTGVLGEVEANLSVGQVNALALQPDGRIVLGGDFTQVNGFDRRGVARLRAGGQVDTTFNPGRGLTNAVNPLFNRGFARALALQPDGRILMAGCFTHVDGVARPTVARLLPNGSVDLGFNARRGPCEFDFDNLFPPVQTLALEANGHILLGGVICGGGLTCTNLLRLNQDGSADDSFDFTVTSGPVNAIRVQPDGQILIGGSFTDIDGVRAPGLARLNGGVFRFEFHSLTRLADGRARLTFAMPRGQSYTLQASGDLIHWTDLNLNRPLRDSTEFTDIGAALFSRRFYRSRKLE